MGKSRGQRRAYLKKYASDYINTLKGVNRDAIGEYHDRVGTTRGAKHRVEPILNNTFMQEIPPTRGMWDPDKCEFQIPWIANQRQQGMETWIRTLLVEMQHEGYNLYLLRCGNRSRLVKVFRTSAIFSSIYSSRDEAIAAWETKTIIWRHAIDRPKQPSTTG